MLKLKNKNLFYLAAAIILLLFFSGSIPVLRSPLVNSLKYPLTVLSFFGKQAENIAFSYRNAAMLKQARKETDLLKYKLNNAREAYLENKRLKQLLSFKQKSPHKLIAASLIGRSSDNWASVGIIDKGRNSGIRPGQTVISFLGLAGRIVEAAQATSKVMLINDPGLGVSALVQRSRQEGLVCGTLGNALIMRYLPADADIKESDIIVTSGLTEMYPKGLIIGVVGETGLEFSGLSRYAIIRPAVNLSALEEVLVIVD